MSDSFDANEVGPKLTDYSILESYCSINGMHRAAIAVALFESRNRSPLLRRSVALALAANYVAALEDIVLWFFALREWKPGSVYLFDLLDRIQVSEGPTQRYSSSRALKELMRWTTNDVTREFGIDERLLSAGHEAGLEECLVLLRAACSARIADEASIVGAANKIKHGGLAVATTEHSPSKVSFMIASRRGPRMTNGKRMVNVAWLPCDDSALLQLVNDTITATKGLWLLLNLMFITKAERDWTPPAWPFPEISA